MENVMKKIFFNINGKESLSICCVVEILMLYFSLSLNERYRSISEILE